MSCVHFWTTERALGWFISLHITILGTWCVWMCSFVTLDVVIWPIPITQNVVILTTYLCGPSLLHYLLYKYSPYAKPYKPKRYTSFAIYTNSQLVAHSSLILSREKNGQFGRVAWRLFCTGSISDFSTRCVSLVLGVVVGPFNGGFG